MKTQHIEFKKNNSDADASLIVEVNQSCQIISAEVYSEFLDGWIEATLFVKNSEYWIKIIADRFMELDWNLQRDDHHSYSDLLRERVADIIGIKIS